MKRVILFIAALLSVAGAQLMADCTACAMKHGASKEERKARKEQKKKNRKKRKEAKEHNRQSDSKSN